MFWSFDVFPKCQIEVPREFSTFKSANVWTLALVSSYTYDGVLRGLSKAYDTRMLFVCHYDRPVLPSTGG